MKIQNLFENNEMLLPEQFKWCQDHVDMFNLHSDSEFFLKDGRIETKRLFLYIVDYYQDEDPLPKSVRFGNVNIMTFKDCQLENFDMLPSSSKSISFKEDTEIIPKTIKGLAKTLKSCERLEIPRSVQKGLLEVFKIKGMKEVIYNGNKNGKKQSAIEIAISIVNQHLRDNKDVFDCQEVLHDRGFGDFC